MRYNETTRKQELALRELSAPLLAVSAHVVLTRIRPEIAQTRVGLGTDLSEVMTRSPLQSGLYVRSAKSD